MNEMNSASAYIGAFFGENHFLRHEKGALKPHFMFCTDVLFYLSHYRAQQLTKIGIDVNQP
jgi:hypothetical protein